ncbi:MAG: transglycosylase family protein [Chloroflexi bacterium]|nr:transglycosylase family protein [Chloroflexota bacterium]
MAALAFWLAAVLFVIDVSVLSGWLRAGSAAAQPPAPAVTAAPTPRPVARATSQPRAVTYSGDSVWDDLAKCESGGNWSINTGNGYYGGLQFNYGTWHDYGGGEFAEYPHQATREEQIIVAERLRAARGYGPWPACRAKLGLP